MSVVFRDITYTVQLPKRARAAAGGATSKTLLRGVSGYALPGRMLGLMGASGAGKTTLLDVLASRKNSGQMTGTITLNGHPKDIRTFNRITAYVEQTDMHMPLTTVREAVEFSASLRLPSSVPVDQRHLFVDEVMELLELTDIANRLVGAIGAADGLAPGERKRLTIAVELVSNAPVIFLDEPTSGLDSRAAAIVMRVLRKIANTGRTIICTIHQPSAELFLMFDDLLLLQRGGYETFLGPLGRDARNLISYLSSVPGVPAYPVGMNPSSWMLDALGGTNSAAVAAPAAQEGGPDAAAKPAPAAAAASGSPLEGVKLQEFLFKSRVWDAARAILDKNGAPAPGTQPLSFPSRFARTFPSQFAILLRRASNMYYRNVGLNFGRLVALIFLNIIFGTVFYRINQEASDLAGVSSLIASIFMTSAFGAMINMNTIVPATLSARPVFYRETTSWMYDSLAYSLCNFLVEIPVIAMLMLASLPIVYFMMGLSSNAGTFFFHYLAVVILCLVYVSIGQMLAALAPTFEFSQACAGILGPLFFLFGGLWSPPSQMVAGARWFTYIDPITYAFRAIIPPHFYCGAGACRTIIVTSGVVRVPVDVYSYVSTRYEVDFFDRFNNLGYLVIFIAVFQFFAILGARYLRHITR